MVDPFETGVECFAPVNGQYLFISLKGNEWGKRTLALCEVQVFGTPIDDPPWPWPMPIAAQGAPYGGAIFGPDWDTVCSPGNIVFTGCATAFGPFQPLATNSPAAHTAGIACV
jgi:hypothetical protein